jgi:hypothetical protein
VPNPVAVRSSKVKTTPVRVMMIAQGMKPIITLMMVFPRSRSERLGCFYLRVDAPPECERAYDSFLHI